MSTIAATEICIYFCSGIADDASQENEISTIFKHIKEKEGGKLDILINNAYDYDYIKTLDIKNSIPPWDPSRKEILDNFFNQCQGLRKQLISLSLASRQVQITYHF